MNQLRFPMGILLFAVLLSAAWAETIAVAVSYRDAEDRAHALGLLVEQGAMEYLFQQGHIVFNVEVDREDDQYTYRAIDVAREGGAVYLFILDVEWDQVTTSGLIPHSLLTRVMGVIAEEEIGRHTLEAASFDRFGEMSAQKLAERIGGAAAEAALDDMRERVGGGASTW